MSEQQASYSLNGLPCGGTVSGEQIEGGLDMSGDPMSFEGDRWGTWSKEPDPMQEMANAEHARAEAREALALLWNTLRAQPEIEGYWPELVDAYRILLKAIGGGEE